MVYITILYKEEETHTRKIELPALYGQQEAEQMEGHKPMKRRFHRKNKKISRTEGGSLLYVIFFVTLLSILSCGYMAASKYHIRAALKNRAYMEARLTARMIHNSFCEAVRMGESEALGLLMDEFENDSSDLEADEENDEAASWHDGR